MKKSPRSGFYRISALLLALLLSLLIPSSARADVAPPEQPPGTNIVPGAETTRVRMVAETVKMIVLSRPADGRIGQAKTEAVFMMRNLGSTEERMEVRFPLTFWNNYSDGFGNYPEIGDIQIEVDGRSVSTRRAEKDIFDGGIAYNQAPWATFDVTFPPGKDVFIKVTYTANGYGYEPYFALRYILETGAGWNGTIGSADIIVELPYEANDQNVMLVETTGFSTTTPGVEFVGKQIRWHFEDFEPTYENNIEISLVQPSQWRKVLEETANVAKNPNDGEAWGRLGKAYKGIGVLGGKGFFRTDPASEQIFQLSAQAYEKAVTLLPGDALWHYGFADLLWTHYVTNYYGMRREGLPEFSRALDELRQSLALDPKNQAARDLASWIAGQYPWAMSETDQGYNFLLLTATPTQPPETATPLPELSATPQPVATFTPTAIPFTPTVFVTDAPPELLPTPVPSVASPLRSLPLCGGAALLPLLAGLLWIFSRRQP